MTLPAKSTTDKGGIIKKNMFLYDSGSTNHHKGKPASESRLKLFRSQGPPKSWGTLRAETHRSNVESLRALKVIRGGKEKRAL
jgi:hypothetical protein